MSLPFSGSHNTNCLARRWGHLGLVNLISVCFCGWLSFWWRAWSKPWKPNGRLCCQVQCISIFIARWGVASRQSWQRNRFYHVLRRSWSPEERAAPPAVIQPLVLALDSPTLIPVIYWRTWQKCKRRKTSPSSPSNWNHSLLPFSTTTVLMLWTSSWQRDSIQSAENVCLTMTNNVVTFQWIP